MQTNGRSIYQSLLAETDEEARDEYVYDPRVAMFDARNTTETPAVPVDAPATEYIATDAGPSDEREHAVQNIPEMVERSYTVVIDTANRDWTFQPNAYSNMFSFGYENNIDINGPQTPYYFNNSFIPLAAYESPLPVPNSPLPVQTVANIFPQPFPPGVPAPSYFNLTSQSQTVQPVYGWRIVFKNGLPIHFPQPFSYADPTVQVFFYPPYNPALTRGAQIGVDIQPRRSGATYYSYTSTKRFQKVTRIRLIRATLPMRSLSVYAPGTFNPPIQYPDGFHTKPYILLNVSNLNGIQYGGGQAIQKSFTALVQGQRSAYAMSEPFPAQFTDYYPWDENNAIFRFDPPLDKMSNADMQLLSSYGELIVQNDTMNVIALQFQTGSNFGKVKFFISQNTGTTTLYGDNNVFYQKELAVGDEIAFYVPGIVGCASDSSGTQITATFFNALSNGMLVTDICNSDFATQTIFPTAGYMTSFMAVPKSSNVYMTWSALSVTTSSLCLQRYSQAPYSFMSNRSFSEDRWIPIMNLHTQAAFALEITVQEPDISKIKNENIAVN
uniref:Uncharacterized protein n=1 Tax=viral metagenome TaxID=1070528 RepID=A0A6C0K4V2_9ZZZZ